MITILTITARQDPMFSKMTESLHLAISNCPIDCEWLVVDALLWYDEARRRQELRHIVGERFRYRHIPPKPSKWHGPWKDRTLGDKELPDTNGARNTGLIHARGDYLILFDDCSIMTTGLLKSAAHYRQQGIACAWWFERGTSWAHMLGPRGDAPNEGDACGYRGSAVGYPVEEILKINGWDEIFGGKRSGNDMELSFRLKNNGCRMWYDFTEGVLEHPHSPLHHHEAYHTQDNDELLDVLVNSDSITQPRGNDFDVRELRKAFA